MNILNYVGRTPIVKIKNLYGEQYPDIYLKLEEFNPGGSIKTRVDLDTGDRGRLKRYSTGGFSNSDSLKGYKLLQIIAEISSGTNLLAALKLSKSLDKEKVIVTISPDNGKKMKF